MKLAPIAVLAALASFAFAPRVLAFTWPDAVDRIARDLASPDAEVRRGGADKLRALTPGAAEPLLLGALADPDVEVRIAAARAAVAKHVVAAAHPVLEWLGERDVRLRVAACEVLGGLPDPAGVAQLARALGDSETSVRAAAAAALGAQSSAEATPPLLGKLDDASPAVRAEVVRALTRLGDGRAVVPLVGKVQDSVPEVRQAVARALAELGDLRAAPALVLQLRDASNDVRSAALRALGQLRADKATDAIAPLASDRNPLLRRVAVEALGRIGSPEAIRALVGLLGTSDDATAGLEPSPVREALVSGGAAAVPALRGVLSGPSSVATASSAAWVLGELRSVESIEDVVLAMRRGTLPATAALHALARMGSAPSEAAGPGARSLEAVAVVLEFVDDASPSIRHEALEAADELLDPTQPDGRAVEPLTAALKDPLLTTVERAKLASLLGRTGASRAKPALEALLTAKDPQLRLAAIDALGALGPTGADVPLLAQLDDLDPAVRLHAAIAIGHAGGAPSRDALVASLSRDADVDTSATLAALGGVLARVPSEAAVAALDEAMKLAPGPDRDPIILALGRAETSGAVGVLRRVLASPNADDRRTLATVLPARSPSPAIGEMLGALLSDSEPAVVAEAAWATGDVANPAALPALRRIIAAPDLAPAIDAAAAVGRIVARAHAAAAVASDVCPLLGDVRAYVRANALAGLAVARARCGDGGTERRLLGLGPVAVRRAAARAVLATPLGAADAAALDRCKTSDASGAVAKLCAARSWAPAAGTEPVEIYVEGEVGASPQPGAPYVVELADGFLRAGRCDRRGAVFDPVAPRGDVSLLSIAGSRD